MPQPIIRGGGIIQTFHGFKEHIREVYQTVQHSQVVHSLQGPMQCYIRASQPL